MNRSFYLFVLANETDLASEIKYEMILYYGSFSFHDKNERLSAFLEKKSSTYKNC